MALNDNYNNGNKEYSPTVYSPYRYSNMDSIDPSRLGYSYWKNLCKIQITPCLNGKEVYNSNYTIQPQYDQKNNGSIYLTHTNARILATEIEKFLSDETITNVGVASNSSIITIERNVSSLSGKNGYAIVIRQVDENGKITRAFAYQPKIDNSFAVRDYNTDNGSFSKVYEDYSDLELLQMITLLKTFYESSTYATAYSVIDASHYSNNKLSMKIDTIGNKMGIKFNTSNKSYNGGSNTSYFANNNGQQNNQSTDDSNFDYGSIDDII